MFVCLCTGATSELVADAVAKGALTSKQVTAACGAGADCGRCRRTVRAIIASVNGTPASHTRIGSALGSSGCAMGPTPCAEHACAAMGS
ncbi:(2Fe-2S)-binding protein [Mycolicibacterium holsaticum DSM 44478 = JCM 12374]|nr:(2Fe-2S)-binding protein [Mycolicibacterium holsaticum]QZA11179.1 (2Fe-2S)-binding protein [Mycolicibacterium holsaticum DSM 44478 = JCM 12374]UNC11327.1 (2Fe-2S)-binding protein [Mycolicibacterium holsaticum DSM 44478 = JCM 12374]